MVKIFQLSEDAIKKRAMEAQQRMETRSDGQKMDIPWGRLQQGLNILRLMPPYSEKGMVIKVVGKHFNIREQDESHPRCLVMTHERDVPDIICPFCKVIEEIHMMYPDANLNPYVAKPRGYAWCISKKPQSEGPVLYEFPATVSDWIEIQLGNLDWRIADPGEPGKAGTGGIDMHITKVGTTWKDTKYPSNTLIPTRSPLAPDQETLEKWLNIVTDLDVLFKVPDTGAYDTLVIRAERFKQSFIKKLEQSSIPTHMGRSNVIPPAEIRSRGYPKGPPSQIVSGNGTTQPSTLSNHKVLQNIPAVNAKPPCFGGAVPHSDGRSSYQADSVQCQLCSYELECADISLNKESDVPY